MTPFEQRMAEFHERFLERAARDAESISQALSAGDHATVRTICHGLSGNAGMFGFADVGTLAEAVEHAVERHANDEEVRRLSEDLLARLGRLPHER